MPEPLAQERPLVELSDDEKIEDYLDYCVASEAIEEALETSKIMKTSDFAKELGFEL
jgi:dihydroneopterin aldolase